MTHNEFSFSIHFTDPLKAFIKKIGFQATVTIDPIDIVSIPTEIYFDRFKASQNY